MNNIPVTSLETSIFARLNGGTRPVEKVFSAAALGCISASSFETPTPLPATATARMDGYWIGAGSGPHRLIAQAGPGDAMPSAPGPDEAVQIMTGAALPDSCAGVIPVEQTRLEDGQVVVEDTTLSPPFAAGMRMAAKTPLLKTGHPVTIAAIGPLVDFGHDTVPVYEPLAVDILATGSELTTTGNHVNSNGPTLAALVGAAGGCPTVHDAVADDPSAITAALTGCTAPLILTTGGTAKGLRDLTRQAIVDAGYNLWIDGLAVRPGQTTRLFRAQHEDGDRLVVSLPGSPGALIGLFALLVGPLLRRLSGEVAVQIPWHQAHLSTDYTRRRLAATLSPAQVALDRGQLTVDAAGRRGNGFVLLPEGDQPVLAGTLLPVLLGPDGCPRAC